MAVKVTGIQRVKLGLKRVADDEMQRRTRKALHAILSEGSARAALMTPVDTSNLINSQYAPRITTGPARSSGHVGYTADYAAFVHSAPGVLKGQPRANGRGEYWDPSGEPGFLTKGFDEVIPRIDVILRSIYGS